MEKEFKGIVYKATNLINGKVYIGQTTQDFEAYKKSHINHALKGDSNRKFYQAIRKYGVSNFKWDIIAECSSKNELNKAEEGAIFINKAFGEDGEHLDYKFGYNVTPFAKGGDTFTNNPNLEDIKQKISDNHHLKDRSYAGVYGGRSDEIKYNIGSYLRGISYEEKYGKEKADELKRNRGIILSIKNRKILPISDNDIVTLFRAGESTFGIAQKCKCSNDMITKILRKNDKEYYKIHKNKPYAQRRLK